MKAHTKITGAVVAGILAVAIFLAAGCGAEGKKPPKTSGKDPADSGVVKVVVAEVNNGPFDDWGSYSADLRGIEDATSLRPPRAAASMRSSPWARGLGPATHCATSTATNTARRWRRQRPFFHI